MKYITDYCLECNQDETVDHVREVVNTGTQYNGPSEIISAKSLPNFKIAGPLGFTGLGFKKVTNLIPNIPYVALRGNVFCILYVTVIDGKVTVYRYYFYPYKAGTFGMQMSGVSPQILSSNRDDMLWLLEFSLQNLNEEQEVHLLLGRILILTFPWFYQTVMHNMTGRGIPPNRRNIEQYLTTSEIEDPTTWLSHSKDVCNEADKCFVSPYQKRLLYNLSNRNLLTERKLMEIVYDKNNTQQIYFRVSPSLNTGYDGFTILTSGVQVTLGTPEVFEECLKIGKYRAAGYWWPLEIDALETLRTTQGKR